ncbi:tail fiber assembly protein [Trabulsiella odontotermitis]|uniref:tail fiber assembly protein n=1 Tax=Trabulsiella odontotermitis TaxID=379893 RepID=UPI0009B9A5BC
MLRLVWKLVQPGAGIVETVGQPVNRGWEKYSVLLSRINLEDAPDIELPEKPE